ncbi:unnamed protein product [Coffea canephora]|uniref:DH200=94 genomic scaffold, scaffold_1530 n=1 Tax=Coffea canephora TaxID=49390 RepID=A0A068VJF6_COFCA|nr:unnamed protein product [Coffea canephora]
MCFFFSVLFYCLLSLGKRDRLIINKQSLRFCYPFFFSGEFKVNYNSRLVIVAWSKPVQIK